MFTLSIDPVFVPVSVAITRASKEIKFASAAVDSADSTARDINCTVPVSVDEYPLPGFVTRQGWISV